MFRIYRTESPVKLACGPNRNKFGDFRNRGGDFPVFTAPFFYDVAKANDKHSNRMIKMYCHSVFEEKYYEVGIPRFFFIYHLISSAQLPPTAQISYQFLAVHTRASSSFLLMNLQEFLKIWMMNIYHRTELKIASTQNHCFNLASKN